MRTIQRLSPFFLLLAVVGDFSFPYFLESKLTRYNHFSSIISILGEESSPVSKQFMYFSITTGCLFILGSLGIHTYFKYETRIISSTLALSIAFYGLGDCIISGVIKINKDQQTFFNPAYFLHAGFTGFAMLGLLFIPLICGINAYQQSQKPLVVFYCVCFFGTLLALFFFSAYYLPIISPYVAPFRGLWQEIALCFLYLPICGIAIKELKITKSKSYYL